MTQESLSDLALVACGTLSPELDHMKSNGLIDPGRIIYTKPGLHQDCRELERQLFAAVKRAQEEYDRVIVVYGGKFCYVNSDEPTRTMDRLIEEMGPGVVRVQATHCMDMVASEEERERLVEGANVWWMTPGWVKYRDSVFAGWDKGTANENFPKHDGGAFVLDGVGLCDEYLNTEPEKILDMSDWMGLPLQGLHVPLQRFRDLIFEAAARLETDRKNGAAE